MKIVKKKMLLSSRNAILMSLICTHSSPTPLSFSLGGGKYILWTERRGDNICLKISVGLSKCCRNSLAFQGLMNHLGGNVLSWNRATLTKIVPLHLNLNVYYMLNFTDVYSNNVTFENIVIRNESKFCLSKIFLYITHEL